MSEFNANLEPVYTTPDSSSSSSQNENHSNSSQNSQYGSAAEPMMQQHVDYGITRALDFSTAQMTTNYDTMEPPSSSSPIVNPFRKHITYCLVCGDKSSGYHYGVLSCEGCKAFFRRCRKRPPAEPYKCSKQNNCRIDLGSRHRCQKCRFDKCISLGMDFGGSASKFKRGPQLPKPDQDPEAPAKNPLSPEEFRYVQKLIETHKEHCPTTKEKIQNLQLVQYNMELPDSRYGLVNRRIEAWRRFAPEIENDIALTANFIASLNDTFKPADRAILFKKSAFSMFFLRAVPGMNADGMILPDGRVVKLKDLNILYGEHLIVKMYQLASTCQVNQFGDDEIAMLCLLSFYSPVEEHEMTPFTAQFKEIEVVKKAHEGYKKWFEGYHKMQNFTALKFTEFMRLVKEIKEINKMHNDTVIPFLREHRQQFESNEIFNEVYITEFVQYHEQQQEAEAKDARGAREEEQLQQQEEVLQEPGLVEVNYQEEQVLEPGFVGKEYGEGPEFGHYNNNGNNGDYSGY